MTSVPPGGPAWYRGRPSDLDLRCSDVERTEVNNALCRHFGEGRLTESELNERLAAVAAAKTRRDLSGLLQDLPRPGDPTAPAGRPRAFGLLGPAAIALVAVAAVIATVHAAVAPFHFGWIFIVLAAVWLFGRRRHHHHHDRGAGQHGWGAPPAPWPSDRR